MSQIKTQGEGSLSALFSGILQAAAVELPKETGAVAKFEENKKRLDARMVGATNRSVLLCDTSGSMNEKAGRARKIDTLRQALGFVWPDVTSAGPSSIVAFDSVPVMVASPADIGEPGSSTALHLALEMAARHKPSRTIVLTDGHPDSEDAALAAAALLTGRIDVIYIGPDGDKEAIAFLRRLATVGCGTVTVHDLKKRSGGARELMIATKAVLALPAYEKP